MTDRRQQAVDNNVGLYRTVLAAQGVGFHVADGLAFTTERAPPYYSNAVTRSPDWRPDPAFRAIADRARRDGRPDWSIKDSFQTLDLAPEGFEVLFEAEWLHLDSAALGPAASGTIRFEILRTEQALQPWWASWDPDPALGPMIFGPGLLGDPDLLILGGYEDGTLVAGCVVNRTGSMLGLSNWFSTRPEVRWSDALRAAFLATGAAPVVGYAQGDDAARLKDIGFVAVGPLTVWRFRRP